MYSPTFIHIHVVCYFKLLQSVPYYFGYKTEFVFFQNSPKNLDPSYKMDLDLWDCLGRVKLVLQRKSQD